MQGEEIDEAVSDREGKKTGAGREEEAELVAAEDEKEPWRRLTAEEFTTKLELVGEEAGRGGCGGATPPFPFPLPLDTFSPPRTVSRPTFAVLRKQKKKQKTKDTDETVKVV